MDAFSLFQGWIFIFTISTIFLPIVQVLDWKKRGTADGYSSVNFVIPLFTMSCWLRFAFMTDHTINKFFYFLGLSAFSMYIICFAYYQPARKTLYKQLLSLFIGVFAIFTYVDSLDSSQTVHTMGSIASGMQIVSLAGGVYKIKRAISMGTTEYIPSSMQFAYFIHSTQLSLYGYLDGNPYLMVSYLVGLAVNIITISLYFVYPPITWRVPLIGTQQEKKME